MSHGLLRKYWDTGLYEMTYINTSNLSEPSQFIIYIALETIYLNHADNFSTKLLPQPSAKTSRAVKKKKKKKPVYIHRRGDIIFQIMVSLPCFDCIERLSKLYPSSKLSYFALYLPSEGHVQVGW